MDFRFRLFIYGMFSNWGIVILANIIGLIFISIIGIDLVRIATPISYAILSIGLYLTLPQSHDFRIGYMVGFAVGLIFLIKFYYALFIGI